ncbi:hypothetical protein BOX15_Mlig010013g2 [Macrostomum lignano]|uniref:Aftiphilin clathrin-binding box domain-containing protein n=1 Tax=Macrostomum lignano TaxID=282301 RepID=A0A267G3R0_9PLAT|nr:hypothetical protein BOX15_Mlig010013g2 [Macrostomum lignano]
MALEDSIATGNSNGHLATDVGAGTENYNEWHAVDAAKGEDKEARVSKTDECLATNAGSDNNMDSCLATSAANDNNNGSCLVTSAANDNNNGSCLGTSPADDSSSGSCLATSLANDSSDSCLATGVRKADSPLATNDSESGNCLATSAAADWPVDFADFSGPPSGFGQPGNQVAADDDDQWADFGEAVAIETTGTADAGLDDDDFDDFEEFQSATVEGLEQQQQQRHLTRMCSDLHAALEKLLNDALGDADAAVPDCPAEEAAAIDESVLSSLLLAESPAQMEAVSDIVTRAAHSQPATANVWSNLLDLDNSPAVKYQWSQSRFYQDLLSTMRIDPNNVLVSRRPVAAQSALCSAQGASQQFGDCGRFGGAAAALQPHQQQRPQPPSLSTARPTSAALATAGPPPPR